MIWNNFLGLNNPISRVIYQEGYRNSERVTESFRFSFEKISLPCAMLPNLFVTLYAYFITGDGEYILPFEAW